MRLKLPYVKSDRGQPARYLVYKDGVLQGQSFGSQRAAIKFVLLRDPPWRGDPLFEIRAG